MRVPVHKRRQRPTMPIWLAILLLPIVLPIWLALMLVALVAKGMAAALRRGSA
jgi:predicted nucleic acid-binding Zn ribbon protein